MTSINPYHQNPQPHEPRDPLLVALAMTVSLLIVGASSYLVCTHPRLAGLLGAGSAIAPCWPPWPRSSSGAASNGKPRDPSRSPGAADGQDHLVQRPECVTVTR